jgi:hypothetical protein
LIFHEKNAIILAGQARDKQKESWKQGGVVFRRGKALWMFLGSRLRSLINIQKVWGEVQTLYESRDASIYDAMPLPRGIRDPDSSSAACWCV